MSDMTSRDRVTAALNHEEPDRVPVDFCGSRISGVAAVAYNRLLTHLDKTGEEIRLYDIKQQLPMPSESMIRFMGGDIVQLTRLGPTTGMPFLMLDEWKEGLLSDGSPCLVPAGYDPVYRDDGSIDIMRDGDVFARRPAGALYFDVVTAPLRNAETIEDIDAYVWPDAWSEREEAYIAGETARLWNDTDFAIFAGLPIYSCSFFEIGQVMFGFENLLMNLMLKRDMMERWLDRVLEHHLAVLDRFLPIAGPHIAAIQTNDDFGAQESLLIPPRMYRELFKPRQAAWIERVRKYTDAKIFLHCDGAVADIMDDFVEIGVDILNPLQSGAKGMEPDVVKKRYGDNLSIWGGGVDTQKTLPFGTLSEIRSEVRERIELLKPGGGYVFATIHNIQADISPEKILAVFDTAREYGRY